MQLNCVLRLPAEQLIVLPVVAFPHDDFAFALIHHHTGEAAVPGVAMSDERPQFHFRCDRFGTGFIGRSKKQGHENRERSGAPAIRRLHIEELPHIRSQNYLLT
jgi:hypothetical protein